MVLMLISYENSFAFIKTVKTAGSSIERAMAPEIKGRAVITPILHESLTGIERVDWAHSPRLVKESLNAARGRRFLSMARSAKKDLVGRRGPVHLGEAFSREVSHSSAYEFHQLIGPVEFTRFNKMSILRNPYDWIVSYYFWDKNYPRLDGTLFPGFQDWLARNPERLLQNRRLLEINGEIVMDDLLLFEELPVNLGKWAASHGLNGRAIEHRLKYIRLKSGIRPIGALGSARAIIDPASKELIDYLCDWIFEMCGYRKVLP